MDTQTNRQRDLSESLGASTFVLTHLELFNWGAFAGRHSAQIDLEGTAIIGPTGSGKTTLVDALMTLITANPRYNLASTGGHESDRDLVSYIRGVSGAGNNSGDNEHIARPGKTITGIAARFSDGTNHLCIAAILWLDDTSSAATDLKRLWIFSQVDQLGLDDWLEAHHTGGARSLKQLARDTSGLQVCNNKQEYLASLRRFFEVGENAFTLLNRAAGLKQLNSIDEVFRELVLDDASAFERAAEVAKEFDDLAAIHAELEIARQQEQSLLPIAENWEKRGRHEEQLTLQRQVQTALPIWYAELAHRLAGERMNHIDQLIETRELQSRSLAAQIDTLDKEAQAVRDLYLQLGGANIEQLGEQIKLQQQIVDQRRRAADEYRRLTRRLGLDDSLTAETFVVNQEHARKRQAAQREILSQQKQEAWNQGVAQQRDQQTLTDLQHELQQIRARPGSNIPGTYQAFRSELASHLSLEEEELPFVAELVEVKSEESRWRGAIERAIGGHRMRVMVPPSHIKEALAWINQRDNRLHVRLLEVEVATAAPEFISDGFTRKVKFKRHAYQEPLQRLMSGIDRHCVASPELLRDIPRGLTEQGLMSDRRGLFEKQDQKRLDQDWMTGFDNKDRVASLSHRIREAEGELRNSRQLYETAKQKADGTEAVLHLLEALVEAEFNAVDLPGAQSVLDSLHVRVQALTKPDSDLEKARMRWEEAEQQLKMLRQQQSDREIAKGVLQNDRLQVQSRRERAFFRIGSGLTDALRTLAEQHLGVPSGDMLDQMSELENAAARGLQEVIDRLGEALRTCDQALVRQMAGAKRVDSGALSEVGTEIQDVPTYLERLRQLTEEALPAKLRRFLDYLNQSSDQGVTQLLSDIDNGVSMIEERIEDLNRTLRRVDFQPGCYLRLEPQRVVHESLRTLQQAQRHLRSAGLKDDQGESHFRALQNVINLLRDASERKKTLGARALLDPRYRLQFAVAVIARATGAVIEVRTGSQGGSGGEKEIIASYVLTASLSYALCPEGVSQPLFGTVVLDEAFSKSSQAVAGRIISALHEFGLHPLFVTPNKELRLLRAHTRSAILIHRRGQRATMTSLSWEELEQHALRRISSQKMKSPTDLALRWGKQWELADTREKRLLSPEAWPISLPIGKPTPIEFIRQTHQIRAHLYSWRTVAVGRVVWEVVSFRGGSDPVEVPVEWVLNNPSEWVSACDDPRITQEYQRLERFVAATDPVFHRFLIRQRYLLRDKPDAEVLKAVELANALTPGCASRRPLRALSACGIDTKFFERHRSLLIHLLDLRFDGQVSELGLEAFLDAEDEGEHWLLIAPLGLGLLPFTQQRVRARELAATPLPGSHVLVVENERCLHQLPPLSDTVAVLGAGLNVEWMCAPWLREKRVGYWGDLDTWGLVMLARARERLGHIEPLLMSRELFDAVRSVLAVPEVHPANAQAPPGLTPVERDLFEYLRHLERGRVEQEFLDRDAVSVALNQWRVSSNNALEE